MNASEYFCDQTAIYNCSVRVTALIASHWTDFYEFFVYVEEYLDGLDS